jgi:putative ABC transport system permease protein
MLPPRWRKVVADLGANLTRTILAVLSIAVGVFGIGMVAGASVLTQRDLAASYTAANPAAIEVQAWPGFDDELLSAVGHAPGVADVVGVGLATVRAEVAPGVWRNLVLFAMDDLDELAVNRVRPDGGTWPVADREILLERSGMGSVGYPVGMPLTVELNDGDRRAMRLAGTVFDATQVPTFFTDEMLGYITLDTLEWLGEPRSYNRVYVTVREGAGDMAHLKAVAAEIEQRVARSGRGYYTNIPKPGESPMKFGVDAMMAVLGVLAVLMVFLSMFLIVNTVAGLLLQQRRQIGVMKAVGASGVDITAMYLAYVVLLGLLALLLAAPLGAAAAYANMRFLASLLNFNPGPFTVTPWVIGVQAAVALLVPPLAAVAPVLLSARISVREAVASAGLGRGHFGRGRIDRALERVRFLSRPLLLSLRNTFRRKGRLALTLVTLTLGGAVFIAVLSTQAATGRQVEVFMNYFGEDVRINFAQGYRKDRLAQVALATPGVARVEFWSGGMAPRVRADDSTSEQIQLIAPPWGSTLMQPNVIRGRWLLDGDSNAIVVDTKLLKQEPDLDVGSRITLRIDDKDHELVVVGVQPQQGNGPPIAYVNYDYLSGIYQNAGWSSQIKVVTTSGAPAFQASVADTLLARYKAAGIQVFYSQSKGEWKASMDRQFGVIVIFLAVMAALIAVVGGIGLMGTMSMNVVERTREIGVLRAIGAGDGAIQQIVVAEGALVGAISWAAAAVLALPISWLLCDAIGTSFVGNPLPYAYSLRAVAIWLVVVLALAALASALPARRASRLTVRDVLAYE